MMLNGSLVPLEEEALKQPLLTCPFLKCCQNFFIPVRVILQMMKKLIALP